MKQDVINKCIEQATATIYAVNDAFLDFVRELGGAAHLPEGFTINIPAMRKLEEAIDEATVAGDLQKTEDLCDEYKRRFLAYLAKWRKQVAKAGKVAA